MIKVITYGTYDMLHIGHINLLTRAKAQGDYLIVGVTSEDFDRSRGKLNVSQSQEERIKAIKALDFVDEVIIETHKNQKQEDIVKHNIDKFVIGDDWLGKFDYLNECTEVVYIPRTKGISSTKLRSESLKDIRIGIVGINYDSDRFIEESEFVKNISITSSYTDTKKPRESNSKQQKAKKHYENYDEFLKSDIEAVYICVDIKHQYKHTKKALLAKKHVLCENPIATDNDKLNELFNIAKQNNVLLLMALKTAFMPAFNKLIEEINSGIIGDIKEVRSTFSSLYKQRGYSEEYCSYGATNLLMSYPSLLVNKIANKPKNISFFTQSNGLCDISNRAITTHENDIIGLSTVAIEMKSESSAVISGTKGYIHIPAPWWLTETFTCKFEDTSKEYSFKYEFEGNGFRYMISEFASLIQRKEIYSQRLSMEDMLNINTIITKYNMEIKNDI